MTDDQKARLRRIHRLQREGHQKLFGLQGQTIEALRGALDAVAKTQDEMAKLYQTDNDGEDILDEE